MRLVTWALLLSMPLGAACTATKKNADYSSTNGSSNTATVTATIDAIGDLVAFTAWCYTSCTQVNVTLGSQTATQTGVSGVAGPGSPGSGQGFIYYILSAAASGSQTVTWTVSGTHTDIQVSYVDFGPSAGCTFAHNVDSSLGSCLSGCSSATITAPSITPTVGDLLFSFTWSSEHVNDMDSPWSCPVYTGPGETGDCQFVNTRNVAGYILSASSGSTSNATTVTHASDTWQALISSFTLSGSVSISPVVLFRQVLVRP